MTKPTPSTGFWDHLWTDTMAAGADSPDAATWPNDIDRRKLAFLGPRLPTTGTAVEIGCGSARLLCRVGLGRALKLVAVDNAPAALALSGKTAAAFGLEVEQRLGDALELPIESGSVDVVLSGGLLEHFEDPRAVLSEMMRILRPGGVFYADVVPRKVSWYRRREAARMGKSHFMAPGVHESSFAQGDYLSWLEALGCEDLQAVSCGFYPPGVGTWPKVIRRPIAGLFGVLDGTVVADALGWYFMIAGIKAR